jgi:Fe-S cluster assembly protein SufD
MNMTLVSENPKVSVEHFRRDWQRVFGHAGGDWLANLRRRGMEQFETAGFTNLAPLAKLPFTLAQSDATQAAADIVRRFSFSAAAAAELVLVNGHFSPQLSHLDALPPGVTVGSLAAALDTQRDSLQPVLGRQVDLDAHPFAALNTAFLHDGAWVHLSRGTTLDRPIHLLFVSTPAGSNPCVCHPRLAIVLDENAQATLVESYVGGEGLYWTNAVTEVAVGQNAQVDHCKLQQESPQAFHVANMQVRLAAAAQFVSHSATLGAALARNDLNVVMAGDGAEATLNGLVLLEGRRHADNHTLLDHAQPNCPSHELYKHVLSDQSSGVFKGKILVRPGAQKTDSKQTSKSLLLSDQAVMNSQPALEIYADDVKCTHGSTTGPVDEEMVFYLRSRGVGAEAARHLLTYAFAADITRRIRVDPVRQRLEDFLAASHGLPRDLRITDLGDHNQAAL